MIGIFVTLFINGQIQGMGDAAWNVRLGWRWMLGAEALPAFAFIALLFPIPESPKWLIQAGRNGGQNDAHRIGAAPMRGRRDPGRARGPFPGGGFLSANSSPRPIAFRSSSPW
ncbi:MAG: MFS transporter [Kiritimatiellia bacterium]